MQELLVTTLLMAAATTLLQATVSSTVRANDLTARVKVDITNSLESQQNLQVHCKDKHSDFGVQHVRSGPHYEFGFNPTYRADYFCGFVFNNVLHWFDIYIDKRDWKRCGVYSVCFWLVKESGPCFRRPGAPDNCYPWNRDMIRRRH